jgi:hypothetical protein
MVNIRNIGLIIGYGLLVLCLIMAGWFGHGVWQFYNNQRIYDGFYFESGPTEKIEIIKTVYNYEPSGEWICVNIKGMTYREALRTCQHEAGHELFAEILEKYPEKVSDVFEVLEN